MAENGVIGRDGTLPWRLPADLAFFKQLTTGHTIAMGRKTFDSIGRPLPNRRNIVLTRDPRWSHVGVETANDWAALRTMVADDGDVFVIGGEAIFHLALPWARRVYLTLVHATIEGDTRFPPLPDDEWQLVEDTPRPADDRNAYAMSFRRYERRAR